jgi:hypothetical protein
MRFHFEALPRHTYVANLVATLAVSGPVLLGRKLRPRGAADTPFVAACWTLCARELLGRLTRGRWLSAVVE